MTRTPDARSDATLRALLFAFPPLLGGRPNAEWTVVRNTLLDAARTATDLADFLPYLLADRLRLTLVAALTLGLSMESAMADDADLVAELARLGFTRTQ